MKDLETLKKEVLGYISKTDNYDYLVKLSLHIKSVERYKKVDKITLAISREIDCSESMAEFVADHHEEIYNIISKHIT